MHIVIAQMSHETNTFSPVVSDLARFSPAGSGVPIAGDTAQEMFRGTASCMGGYLTVAEAADAQITIPVVAGAAPSGPVEDEAYEYIAEKIVHAAAQGCDALFLDLHGAMVTRSHEDGEGELLRRLRAVNPDVPIAIALDMHANLYDDIVGLSTIVAGYHTYPHIDMYETAELAGKLLLDHIVNGIKPTMAWGNNPMLPHIMRQGTDDQPNRALQARARKWSVMVPWLSVCSLVFHMQISRKRVCQWWSQQTMTPSWLGACVMNCLIRPGRNVKILSISSSRWNSPLPVPEPWEQNPATTDRY
jgi:microcystin degradation protein MlrC